MNKRNSKLRIGFFLTCLILGLCALSYTSAYSSPSNRVHIIQLDDDTINPVTADYIVQAIDHAYEEDAQCLIIKLDTPGGLLTSTRLIVKHMLTAQVPIVVYISPSGSRAGSAGVFITYASHVAAMAPSTNIGAAHPVQMGGSAPKPGRGGDWDELRELIKDLKSVKKNTENKKSSEKNKEVTPDKNPMESKILQDTVAFIKSIATERGRNIEWGVDSVTKSSSITADEALKNNVVEIIAKDDIDLLAQLDGRVVIIDNQETILQTKEAFIERIPMELSQQFFNVLANPNIAYFLMILGFYGLLYEITHPGFGVPGVLGLIFLILAFYSMQTLPTNYAGLALLLLGLVLLVSEAFVPGLGLLTLGGLVCMILGSMLLFESVDPVMRVSFSAILGLSVTTAIITLFLVRSVIHAHKAKKMGGREGLIGEVGEARCDAKTGENGTVFVHGEIWKAKFETDVQKGDEVEVLEVLGLKIKVKRK